MFEKVYYSSAFGNNSLLSIAQLAMKGVDVIFRGKSARIAKQGQELATATSDIKSRIYTLDQPTIYAFKATIPEDTLHLQPPTLRAYQQGICVKISCLHYWLETTQGRFNMRL